MKYCIIGNSIAATAAIEGIRSLDKTTTINVISEEKDLNYSRPLISYWLEEKVQDEQMFYRDPDFYVQNNVNVLLNQKAVGVDPKRKAISLESGEVLKYDKLLISSGGTPIILPIPGLTDQNHLCFYSYQDVREIKKRIKPGFRAVVLGGGLTGLKAAESLLQIGVEVSVIDLAERLLGTIMNQAGSEIIVNYLQEKGIRVELKNSVTKIEPGQDDLFNFQLKNGTILSAHILIMAIGVKPRIDFLSGSGLQINRGIIVDSYQKTKAPEIYAAGDVAEVPDFLTGQTVVAPILPNAFTQGRIAGRNMAGGNEHFEGSLAYNAIGFIGLHMVSVGQSTLETAPGIEILEEKNLKSHAYRCLTIKENSLIGAIFIQTIGRAGLYHDLIRSRSNIGSIKERLLASDFNLLDLPEEIYQAKLSK
jgi:NAD(P)H-nitrite reductase large subunit